jgi:hypothetical protein
MKAYKVVRNNNGKLESATSDVSVIYDNGICVTYVPNRYVRPVLKSSYLFCFTNLDKAIDFKKQRLSFNPYQTFEVWEVDIKHTTTRGIFTYYYCVEEAWNLISRMIKNHKSIKTVEDEFGNTSAHDTFKNSTIWAKQVKLLRRVG